MDSYNDIIINLLDKSVNISLKIKKKLLREFDCEVIELITSA